MNEGRRLRLADEQWMKDHPELEEHHRPAALLEQVAVWKWKGDAVTHVRLLRCHDIDPKTGRDHQYIVRIFY